MLGVTIICVGGLKDAHYKQAAAEYIKRLSRYCRLEIIELPEYALPAQPSEGEIRRALEQEGLRILSKIPTGAQVFVLSPEGKMLSSEEFSEIPGDAAAVSSRLVFVIGGSYGLSPGVKAAAKGLISLSRMTFPHTLARVMLLEQLYRGFKIQAGETYHK